jgi:TRAP-type C4-dicarboxylate transport system substrate-binding protein
MTDAGPATLTGPTPIRTIDDIKGCQIRTNSVNGKAIELLGGTPVIMNMGDVYEAFHNHPP